MGLGKNTELIVVFLAVLVLFVGINSFEDVEAMKSKGTYLTETTSKQVCGNFLCDEPLSIAEKIAAYLLNLALQEEPETNVLHQAFIPGSFGGEGMAPPISPIGEISFQVPDLKMAASQIGAKTFKSLDVKQAAPRDVKALKLAGDLIQKFDLKQERLLPTVAKVAENFQPSLDRDKITQIRIAQKELEKFKPKISEFKDFELKENVSTETYQLTIIASQSVSDVASKLEPFLRAIFELKLASLGLTCEEAKGAVVHAEAGLFAANTAYAFAKADETASEILVEPARQSCVLSKSLYKAAVDEKNRQCGMIANIGGCEIARTVRDHTEDAKDYSCGIYAAAVEKHNANVELSEFAGDVVESTEKALEMAKKVKDYICRT